MFASLSGLGATATQAASAVAESGVGQAVAGAASAVTDVVNGVGNLANEALGGVPQKLGMTPNGGTDGGVFDGPVGSVIKQTKTGAKIDLLDRAYGLYQKNGGDFGAVAADAFNEGLIGELLQSGDSSQPPPLPEDQIIPMRKPRQQFGASPVSEVLAQLGLGR